MPDHGFSSMVRQPITMVGPSTYNPAYMHPDDLQTLGLCVGDQIELESAHGRVVAIVDRDAQIKHPELTGTR